jgi:serine/threonine protein kinase
MDYQSPEMLMDKEYGTSTDIWSLGILIYELLSGKTPRMNRKKPESGVNVSESSNSVSA